MTPPRVRLPCLVRLMVGLFAWDGRGVAKLWPARSPRGFGGGRGRGEADRRHRPGRCRRARSVDLARVGIQRRGDRLVHPGQPPRRRRRGSGLVAHPRAIVGPEVPMGLAQPQVKPAGRPTQVFAPSSTEGGAEGVPPRDGWTRMPTGPRSLSPGKAESPARAPRSSGTAAGRPTLASTSTSTTGS